MAYEAGESCSILEPSWKIVGASVIGTSHERLGGRCEDAWSFHNLKVKEGFCLGICVCDGAGSAPKGWVGAGAASRLVPEWITSNFEILYRGDDDLWRKSFWKNIRKPIEIMASRSKSKLKDYACTVVSSVVHSDGRWMVVHIGDGAVVGRFENGSRILSFPAKGEHANETYFLTDASLQNSATLTRGSSEDKSGVLTGFALFSDGLEGSLISKSDGQVAPAVSQMLGWLDGYDASDVLPALKKNLIDVFRPLTSDDCTLVIATKNQAFS